MRRKMRQKANPNNESKMAESSVSQLMTGRLHARSFHAYHTACDGLHVGSPSAQRPKTDSGCKGFQRWLK